MRNVTQPTDLRASGNGFEVSRQRIAQSAQYLAGGVGSNFRMGISPTPLVFERAEGPILFDADGNRLIDYYLGMGPMILGHSPAEVCRAVERQLSRGILFGGQSGIEARAAELVCEMVPCAERVRFNSCGSEAVQAALRLARAATGREQLVKFAGHYHGWFDNVLWSTAPPQGATGPVAGSRGQLAQTADTLTVLPWNDLQALRARLQQRDVAGVIMEPAMCNAGSIAPLPGYLEGVRAACDESGTVLIFDEVITGFRLGPGGAQGRFGVTPDLAVFAKAIASGFPVAAIAGRAEIMDLFQHGVVHGGTYNGQAVAMAACVATLERLGQSGAYQRIEQQGQRLMEGIGSRLSEAGILSVVSGFPAIFHVAFGLSSAARDWTDLLGVDRQRYVAFTTALLSRGVRALERGAWFLSTEHDDAVIDATLDAVSSAAREVARV
jgi:glutamate-1-semialdehyde 2,1-aminomutase